MGLETLFFPQETPQIHYTGRSSVILLSNQRKSRETALHMFVY